MIDAQLSRYGIDSLRVPYISPAAKIHFVGLSSLAWWGDFVSAYGPDADGGNRAFASIEAAMNDSNVVSGRGDVILVLPGHVETVTAAAGLDIDKAGTTIIGLGNGTLRPTINFTTSTAADMDIDASNVTIDGLIFDLTGIDALVAPIDVNSTYFTLRNCLVITADSGGQATLGILTDANAGGIRIEGCEFLGTTDAGTAAAIRIVGGNEHVIKDNRFYGAYTTTLGAIDNATTACLRVQVTGNFIQNATASSTVAMTFQAGSTGVIANNRMQILSGTAPVVGAAMSWAGGNYYAATIATAGVLI